MSTLGSALLPDLNVSRETMDRLEAYGDLIRKWTPKINLIAKNSVQDLWQRHIIDSAQLVPLASDAPEVWADLGSGGGLPGIVVSIILPKTQVVMIESDQRKATFLRTCIRELGLNASVLSERIETAEPLNATIVTARALAPLPALLPLVARHLTPSGTALLPKGQKAQEELASACENWAFDLTTIPSHTHPDAAILRLERITRA